jgi:hypothetical protein
MLLEVVDRKPKKLFGKKKPKLEVVRDTSGESVSVVEPIDLFSQSLKQEVLLQDKRIEEVLKSSENVSVFPGPRVLDWERSTGRVALAESVIRGSEQEFIAFKRQMEMMADKDGCGGVNERVNAGSFEQASVLQVKSIVQVLNGGQNRHKHEPGNHEHCDHGNDYGECPKGCRKAA